MARLPPDFPARLPAGFPARLPAGLLARLPAGFPALAGVACLVEPVERAIAWGAGKVANAWAAQRRAALCHDVPETPLNLPRRP